MDPLTYCLREISLSGTVGLSQEALIESLKASYSSLVSSPTALRNLLQTLAQFLRQHADTPDEVPSPNASHPDGSGQVYRLSDSVLHGLIGVSRLPPAMRAPLRVRALHVIFCARDAGQTSKDLCEALGIDAVTLAFQMKALVDSGTVVEFNNHRIKAYRHFLFVRGHVASTRQTSLHKGNHEVILKRVRDHIKNKGHEYAVQLRHEFKLGRRHLAWVVRKVPEHYPEIAVQYERTADSSRVLVKLVYKPNVGLSAASAIGGTVAQVSGSSSSGSSQVKGSNSSSIAAPYYLQTMFISGLVDRALHLIGNNPNYYSAHLSSDLAIRPRQGANILEHLVSAHGVTRASETVRKSRTFVLRLPSAAPMSPAATNLAGSDWAKKLQDKGIYASARNIARLGLVAQFIADNECVFTTDIQRYIHSIEKDVQIDRKSVQALTAVLCEAGVVHLVKVAYYAALYTVYASVPQITEEMRDRLLSKLRAAQQSYKTKREVVVGTGPGVPLESISVVRPKPSSRVGVDMISRGFVVAKYVRAVLLLLAIPMNVPVTSAEILAALSAETFVRVCGLSPDPRQRAKKWARVKLAESLTILSRPPWNLLNASTPQATYMRVVTDDEIFSKVGDLFRSGVGEASDWLELANTLEISLRRLDMELTQRGYPATTSNQQTENIISVDELRPIVRTLPTPPPLIQALLWVIRYRPLGIFAVRYESDTLNSRYGFRLPKGLAWPKRRRSKESARAPQLLNEVEMEHNKKAVQRRPETKQRERWSHAKTMKLLRLYAWEKAISLFSHSSRVLAHAWPRISEKMGNVAQNRLESHVQKSQESPLYRNMVKAWTDAALQWLRTHPEVSRQVTYHFLKLAVQSGDGQNENRAEGTVPVQEFVVTDEFLTQLMDQDANPSSITVEGTVSQSSQERYVPAEEFDWNPRPTIATPAVMTGLQSHEQPTVDASTWSLVYSILCTQGGVNRSQVGSKIASDPAAFDSVVSFLLKRKVVLDTVPIVIAPRLIELLENKSMLPFVHGFASGWLDSSAQDEDPFLMHCLLMLGRPFLDKTLITPHLPSTATSDVPMIHDELDEDDEDEDQDDEDDEEDEDKAARGFRRPRVRMDELPSQLMMGDLQAIRTCYSEFCTSFRAYRNLNGKSRRRLWWVNMQGGLSKMHIRLCGVLLTFLWSYPCVLRVDLYSRFLSRQGEDALWMDALFAAGDAADECLDTLTMIGGIENRDGVVHVKSDACIRLMALSEALFGQ